jgi:hypothetical protein
MLTAEIHDLLAAVSGPTAAALCTRGGAVAHTDGELTWWIEDGVPQRIRLGFAASSLSLSRDGIFLGAVAARSRLVFVELLTGRERFTLEASDARRQPLSATLCTDKGSRQLGFFTRTPGVLEGLDLVSGERFERQLATFRVTALQTLGRGRHLGLLGHFEGETKDSFAIASVDDIVVSPDGISDQLRCKTGVQDYAYRLGLGPCGGDAIVACRDPEDDEDEAEPEAGPVYGFRGFYVRSLDGTIRERMCWPAEIPTGSLCGHDGIVAWAEPYRVNLARLADASAIQIAGQWLAAAPDGNKVLVVSSEARVGLLEWR